MRLTLLLGALAVMMYLALSGADDDAQRLGLQSAPERAIAPTPAVALREAPDPAPVEREASLAAPDPAPEPAPEPSAAPVAEAPPPAADPLAGAAPLDAPEPVAEAEPAAAPEPVAEAAPETSAPADIRTVSTEALNVRSGPSTGFGVIGQLLEGETVRVVAEDPNGWVQVVIEGDGIEGWVAGRLLSPAN